ncbi:hypothetical protein E2C01_038245 [Portunus trituberculatus]|uniref:Uncharacterized protein n=1 Tax=Portunus trituberculatus TaxID=210409 RepID=A0A5B7FAC6_PORTR|nr:hypothetical protein [Portunus trituberculatus]
MDLSDICSRWATGGMRAREAGRRVTSDFMSDKSSSSWLSTWKGLHLENKTLSLDILSNLALLIYLKTYLRCQISHSLPGTAAFSSFCHISSSFFSTVATSSSFSFCLYQN